MRERQIYAGICSDRSAADIYQIIALNAPVNPQLSGPSATKEQIAEDIKGKVIAWGKWVGVAERKWK
jgi:hypothetical protein